MNLLGIDFLLLLVTIYCFFIQVEAYYQLPEDVTPVEYKLNIQASPERSSKYKGEVWMTIECKTDTSVIKFHSQGLRILVNGKRKLRITEKGKELKLKISEIEQEEEYDHFIIKLSKPVEKDKTYVVYLSFEGDWSETGLFRNSYIDSTGSTRWYAATNSHTGARSIFPCFDEPRFRAKFSIRIGVRNPYIPISNMPFSQKDSSQYQKNESHSFLKFLSVKKLYQIVRSYISRLSRLSTRIVWYSFQETQKISPHQVNFVITRLDTREVATPGATTSLQLWAQKTSIGLVEAAANDPQKTVSVILPFYDFYKDYFNIDCPLTKINLVSLPDSGHNSNFGILIEQYSMNSSVPVESVISPLNMEMDCANFSASLDDPSAHEVYPNWNIVNRIFVTRVLNTYKEDSKNSAFTVLMPIAVPEEVLTEYYNEIFNDKGPLLIRMVNMLLGDKLFQAGLNAFLKTYQHSSATTKDLWKSLSKVAQDAEVLRSELSLETIMHNWLTRHGYPLITATRNYETSTITVSQKLFEKGNPEEDDPDDCWWVPLTFSTYQKPEFSNTIPEKWLNCDEKQISFEIEAADHEWVIFNNKMAGLYRINYDTKNWNLIAAALRQPDFTKIDILNRVQLLTDLWDLLTDELKYKTAFGIFTYLQKETEYLPWRVALEQIKIIKENIFRTAEAEVFLSYMQNLLIQVFEKFNGLNKSEDEEAKLQRRYIMKWACEYKVAECMEKTKQLFSEWKKSKLPLDRDIRRTVYCQGVRSGEWQYMQAYHGKAEDSDEKKHILFALSCTEDPGTLKRYLEWSIAEDSSIPPQFCFDAFDKIVKTKVGYNLGWKFFFNNMEKIFKHSGRGVDELCMYVTALAEQVISVEELKELKNEIGEHKILVDCDLEVDYSAAETKIQWLNENYEPIIEAIRQELI